MCKYCEDKKKTDECWKNSRDGRKYYIYRVGERNSGMRTIWDGCNGYMLESLDGVYLSSINYCPWCGRKL